MDTTIQGMEESSVPECIGENVDYRCSCGKSFFVSKESIVLLMGFFSKILDRKSLLPVCDDCGNTVLRNYRDTYGIGV
jgi:hypothetical protein